jgi:hypothetical protein
MENTTSLINKRSSPLSYTAFRSTGGSLVFLSADCLPAESTIEQRGYAAVRDAAFRAPEFPPTAAGPFLNGSRVLAEGPAEQLGHGAHTTVPETATRTRRNPQPPCPFSMKGGFLAGEFEQNRRATVRDAAFQAPSLASIAPPFLNEGRVLTGDRTEKAQQGG